MELIPPSRVDRPHTTLLISSHTPSVHTHANTYTPIIHSMRFALPAFVWVGSYLWSGLWQPYPFSDHLLTFLLSIWGFFFFVSWQLLFFFFFLLNFSLIHLKGTYFTFSCEKHQKSSVANGSSAIYRSQNETLPCPLLPLQVLVLSWLL